jgi:hypothetical protein
MRLLIQNYFCVLTYAVLYHWTKPRGFFPFSSWWGADDVAIVIMATSIGLLFSWDLLPHLYDTFVQAYMLNVALSLSMTGVSALAGLLTGVQMEDRVSDHPLLLSESVSDFWGRRWNILIHVALKRSMYKPVRAAMDSNKNKYSRTFASLAVLCVSGLYHEYVCALLFFVTGVSATTGGGCQGLLSVLLLRLLDRQAANLFGWNGILIALEYWIVGQQAPNVLTPKLQPRLLLRSHLVVLLALPVGHLFTGDLVQAGYFDHIHPAIPVIV